MKTNILETIKKSKFYKTLNKREFRGTKKYMNFADVSLSISVQFEILIRLFEKYHCENSKVVGLKFSG